MLTFGGGARDIDPKRGLSRYGPWSLGTARHPAAVQMGVIGTAATIDATINWLQKTSQGLPGDTDNLDFPGFQDDRGFFSDLRNDSHWQEVLSQSELQALPTRKYQRERFEALVQLLDDKLRLLANQENAPTYVIIALPDEVLNTSVLNYHDTELGMVHRDLRRALKASAMKYRIPTQLLHQSTIDGRDEDHPTRIAWNFFSAMYYKAGGFPWAPDGLTPGSCHIGISFYRPLGTRVSSMQTSLVQAFDEHGEGLVLRGPEFDWDARQTGSRSPHLSAAQANELISTALARYSQVMKQSPTRVAVHKTSRFWPEEEEGIREALAGKVARFDLLALEPQSWGRLLPVSQYPALRGTRFMVGDLDFLYTTGFIAELAQYHGVHVPAPLLVSDHVNRDTPRETLLREVLILSKLNWNAARLGGLFPVTLKFARVTGEILREIPRDVEPLAQFKYYI